MKALRHFIILIIISFALVIGVRNSRAQTEERRYFPETGHWVEGEFLTKYESTENAELVYGNPITERFEDRINLIEVQYFERARFELHPNKFPLVQLSLLGELMYETGISFSPPATARACKRFQSDGPRVCFDFLQFFEKYGGVAQFGVPLSSFEIHDGRIVQYFQRARFEWHPENPFGQQVVLSDLGLSYFLVRGESLALLEHSDFAPLTSPQSLKIHAFPQNPLLPTTGQQIIYVIVQDQYSQPIMGAEVTGSITLPDGRKIPLAIQRTNAEGVAITDPIPISTYQIGVAEVTINVKFNGLEKQTGTSFHIW